MNAAKIHPQRLARPGQEQREREPRAERREKGDENEMPSAEPPGVMVCWRCSRPDHLLDWGDVFLDSLLVGDVHSGQAVDAV